MIDILQSKCKIAGKPEKNLEANFKNASSYVSASDFLIQIKDIELVYVLTTYGTLNWHFSKRNNFYWN